MDLIPYNTAYIAKGNGFINLGNTCYFNSLLQCLLSCSSIFEVLNANKDKEHIRTNPLAQHLMRLNDAALKGEPIYNMGVPIWQSVLRISQERQDNVKMDIGQQDAHEGLMLLLDVIEKSLPEVRRLFEHRYVTKILCDKCKQWVVNKAENNLVFEVQPDLKTEQHEKFKDIDAYYNSSMHMNKFLQKQNGYVDEQFVCPNAECKQSGMKFKTVELSMVPEILPIVLKKYTGKVMTPFPMMLEFYLKKSPKKIIYELVAQSEHSGSNAGGHYWAICRRSDGWKQLNDSSVSEDNPGPTLNTYILFYHFVRMVDLMPDEVRQ